MKLKMVKKPLTPPKRAVVVVADEDEELAQPAVVAKAGKKMVVIREDDDKDAEVIEELEVDSGVFRAEFTRDSRDYNSRRNGPHLELDGLDIDKTYGIEFSKRNTYNISQIRPATGLEIKGRWKELLDYAVVQYFKSSPARRGFRILDLPNGTCIAICDWRGEKYVPETASLAKAKPKIRFKKGNDEPDKNRPNKLVKKPNQKPRLRMGAAGHGKPVIGKKPSGRPVVVIKRGAVRHRR